ncbi:MAG: phosphoglycerate kinase [Myxococcales bacterium]|nr:phosphoglycerate kinase [Myxococcales bacterium]
MNFNTIDKLDVAGRRVFVRVDFNVPIKDGEVTEPTRIEAALPTLLALRERGARLIVASHLGRPKGKRDEKYSLEPVGVLLSELLEQEVIFACDPVGDGPRKLAQDLRDGQLLLLENLRFDPGEEKNDEAFARSLAQLADVYVNDAFGAAHRKHASVYGMVGQFESKAAGLLMQKELTALQHFLEAKEKPIVAILGGAKVADKIPVIDHLLPKVTHVLIGGAMAYTFLAKQGVDVGASLIEEESFDAVARIIDKARLLGVQLLLPEDHAVARELSPEAKVRVVANGQFAADEKGFDIGPRTRDLFAEVIARAKNIFWNGPLGVFEVAPFAAGTLAVARRVAESSAFSVVGGGDSIAAVNQAGVAHRLSHVSTGGGASLEFLSGLSLPGVEALSGATARSVDQLI